MSDIHPLPENPPPAPLRIAPLKLGIFCALLGGVVLFGIRAQSMPATEQVLGEQTSAHAASASASLVQGVSDLTNTLEVQPETVYLTGKELVSSAASELADEASRQTETIASSAAKGLTNFIYKNTVERLINSLIQSLPQERQEQYKK